MSGVQIDGVNNKIDFDDDQDTSISSASDDTLVVEVGGTDRVSFTSTGINLTQDGDSLKFGANSEVVLTHVHDSGLKITHDGGGDPDLILANTASASDGNQLGSVFFNGQNSNGDEHTYAFMLAQARDVTDGEEDGQLVFYGNKGGSDKQFITYGANANGASPTHEVCINEGSEDIDFRVESNGNANMLFVDGGNDVVGIGTSGPNSYNDYANNLVVYENGNAGITIAAGTSSNSSLYFADGTSGNAQYRGWIDYLHASDALRLATAASERMRIDSSGVAMFNTTNVAVAANETGALLGDDGYGAFRRGSGAVVYVNRFTDDGTLIKLHQAGTEEGNISVSGSTVSYNAFTGGHWSRLADNSKPTILRGTIMESLDEMCDWYQAVKNIAEVKYTAEDEEVINKDKNVGDVKEAAHTVKESIALGDKSVGDAITFTSNGTEYTGTIVKEGDVKHTKCKVSDTTDSKKVYGVFSNWDDQDDGLDGDVNDMNIAQVGTYIIRVNKDVTVSAGDLLVSNGDGTAKKQDDDIIRSKTVAKVNSNIKVETYSDGSYTVPCTLHC
jgi:predicted DNA-binding protein